MRQLIYTMKEQYEEFLIDESKFSGYADSISFPESQEEMQEVLLELKKDGYRDYPGRKDWNYRSRRSQRRTCHEPVPYE